MIGDKRSMALFKKPLLESHVLVSDSWCFRASQLLELPVLLPVLGLDLLQALQVRPGKRRQLGLSLASGRPHLCQYSSPIS